MELLLAVYICTLPFFLLSSCYQIYKITSQKERKREKNREANRRRSNHSYDKKPADVVWRPDLKNGKHEMDFSFSEMIEENRKQKAYGNFGNYTHGTKRRITFENRPQVRSIVK